MIIDAMKTQTLSVIIPVWKEASIINLSIEHAENTVKDRLLEIIVVDGDPKGGTINAIRSGRVIRIVSEKGRGLQLNAGALHASGSILVFLHADTRLPMDSGRLIFSAFNNDRIVAGAFDLKIDSDRNIFRIIERMASLRSRLTRIPYGDQAIFIRRDYFRTLGGFHNIPLMEDVELMRRIKQKKDKIHILKRQVITSSRRWEKEGIIYCTARNWALISLYFLGVKPKRLIHFYE